MYPQLKPTTMNYVCHNKYVLVKVRHLMRVSSKFKSPGIPLRFLLCHSCSDHKSVGTEKHSQWCLSYLEFCETHRLLVIARSATQMMKWIHYCQLPHGVTRVEEQLTRTTRLTICSQHCPSNSKFVACCPQIKVMMHSVDFQTAWNLHNLQGRSMR